MRRRVFLNKIGHHSVATIYALVQGKDDYALIMSDCNHTVEFAIDYYNAKDRANTLHKIDTMLKVLTEFRAALEKNFAQKA